MRETRGGVTQVRLEPRTTAERTQPLFKLRHCRAPPILKMLLHQPPNLKGVCCGPRHVLHPDFIENHPGAFP